MKQIWIFGYHRFSPWGRGSYFPKMAARIVEQCLEFDPRKAFIKLFKIKCMVYFK